MRRLGTKFDRHAAAGYPRGVALLAIAMCCRRAGVAGHRQRSIPGARAPAGRHKTIYVQMPDTLALNVNSRVRVADVEVGTVTGDRAEELGRRR